ncbi:uncharacterized protein LOC110464976 isoform X2 [Mizuhopecten yessoensis]|uniref:uncharacterized protein LOC110464976 isoform X2 n=1 Tax=Mizuhopecten yessoensis TaxID=6573 RepID=UPI000B45DF74|nr:uncharacterized protein LOC110464976 isoform X2 [Mizuhopecten yessoensis]
MRNKSSNRKRRTNSTVMAALVSYVNVGLAALFVIVLCLGLSLADQFDYPSIDDENVDDALSADKRYAMMSYGFGRSRGSRNRYHSYWKPWTRLPNQKCYRQKCNSSKDCCRYHNICDKSAKICYDCWYGFPCRSSRDCCERFPRCSSRAKMCTN